MKRMKEETTEQNSEIQKDMYLTSPMTGSPKHGAQWARVQLVPTLERA
jgi:hypothetical protein